MLLTTLLNTTVLSVIFMIVVTSLSLLSKSLGKSAPTVVPSFAEWECAAHRLVLAILFCGVIFGIASRMYLSYLAPGDILSNTISAQEFVHGRPFYPTDLNLLVRNALSERPPREPLSDHLPRLKALQADQFAVSLLNLVNAHPPLFTVVIIPLVALFGIYIPALAVNTLALSLYWYVVVHLRTLLFPQLSPFLQTVFIALCLGWQPVLASIRHANQSLIVSSLILLCWYLLRKEKDLLSGFVLGLAIALKVYPCILLGYLIMRRFRAFAAAVVTTVALTLFVAIVVGVDGLSGFARTAGVITHTFGLARNNVSLLSVISGTLRVVDPSSALPMVVYILTALICVVGVTAVVYLSRSHITERVVQGDIEFALFSCLICLLSPIVWPHYFSLLLLPLAIIARHGVDWSRDRPEKLFFLLVVLVLSVPDQPLRTLADILQARLGQRLGWLVGSLQTFAILATVVWLLILLEYRAKTIFNIGVERFGRSLPQGSQSSASLPIHGNRT